MKIFEITQPQNVTEPEEPVNQQPQQEPAQEPVQQEPARPPRYQWDWPTPGGDLQQHIATQQAAQAQHAGVAATDFDTTIDEFPNPYYKEGGTDDYDDPDYEPDTISIGVDYEFQYHGKYYAATQYDPAEYPELEIKINRVVDLSSGEDITKKVNITDVEEYIENEIPSWEDVDQDARDQAAIDRYEANRDDYYESISSIKRLSGL